MLWGRKWKKNTFRNKVKELEGRGILTIERQYLGRGGTKDHYTFLGDETAVINKYSLTDNLFCRFCIHTPDDTDNRKKDLGSNEDNTENNVLLDDMELLSNPEHFSN